MPGRGHGIAKRHRNEDLQMTTQNQTRAGARDKLSQAAADIAAGQPAAMSTDRPGAATAAPPAGIAGLVFIAPSPYADLAALIIIAPVLISQLPAMRKRRGRFGGANG